MSLINVPSVFGRINTEIYILLSNIFLHDSGNMFNIRWICTQSARLTISSKATLYLLIGFPGSQLNILSII